MSTYILYSYTEAEYFEIKNSKEPLITYNVKVFKL